MQEKTPKRPLEMSDGQRMLAGSINTRLFNTRKQLRIWTMVTASPAAEATTTLYLVVLLDTNTCRKITARP